MIIWRGWGIIGAGFPLLGLLAALGLWSSMGSHGSPLPFMAPMVILAGVGTFFLGRHLNGAAADKKVEQIIADRARHLDELVRTGQFHLAPGVPAPASMDEARFQADSVLNSEREQLRRRFSDVHTLFFIPVQWVGIVVAIIGVAMIPMAIFTR
ncbi:hypothetical protein ACQCX2_05010 [Propionibacteriaceae bacterium Y1700]|uniref:hypothetical protein n=1 Tax=Microlunatus sp. Y1700 TaxID=3418487 RepID=UPI003DA6FA4E